MDRYGRQVGQIKTGAVGTKAPTVFLLDVSVSHMRHSINIWNHIRFIFSLIDIRWGAANVWSVPIFAHLGVLGPLILCGFLYKTPFKGLQLLEFHFSLWQVFTAMYVI